MKFKKLGLVAALVVSAVALTACGTDNKAQFIKDNAELAKLSTAKIDFNTSDLKVEADGTAQAYVPIINAYLSEFKLSGKSMADGKNAQVNVDVSVAGQTIPLEVVMQGNNAYLRLDTLKPLAELYVQYSAASKHFGDIDMTSIKGKYLDTHAISKKWGESSVSVEDFQEAMAKVLDSVDKTDFNQKGSAITLNLSGAKIGKMLKVYIASVGSLTKDMVESLEDKAGDNDLEKEVPKIIKSMTITTDSKKKTSNVVINFTGKKLDNVGLDGKISYQVKYSDEKVTVKIPTKDNLIKSGDELGKLLSESVQVDYSDFENEE
ncbi:lipoprotein [Pseudolactococcus yaeyamensis]